MNLQQEQRDLAFIVTTVDAEAMTVLAGSQLEADMSAGYHKSQSQAEADDGGVIIQETEAYKVSPPEL